MKRLALGIAAVTLVAAAGCTKRALSVKETELATRDFREHYDRKEFGQLYAGAGPEFRASASETLFVAAMTHISQKLGTWQSGKRVATRRVAGNDGKFVFQYESRFTNGEATEDFVWRSDGGKPILVGYHVNSRALGL